MDCEVFFFISPRRKSAAHSSRTLLRGGYKIPAVLKKSRGKASPFPPAKIVLLCLVRIVSRRLLVQSRTPQKSFVFLLEEKMVARKNKNANKNFLWWGER